MQTVLETVRRHVLYLTIPFSLKYTTLNNNSNKQAQKYIIWADDSMFKQNTSPPYTCTLYGGTGKRRFAVKLYLTVRLLITGRQAK
jgi:hypothetical protein